MTPIYWATVRTVRVAHCGACRQELITHGDGTGRLVCRCGASCPDAAALVAALQGEQAEQLTLLEMDR